MNFWALDFETYFSADYSLSKAAYNTESYIRDPQFKAHGCAVRDPSGEIFWVTHADLPAFFKSVDWSNACWLSHHTNFDGLIASHHYDVHPAMLLCTKFLFNQLLPREPKTLDALAKMHNLPAKYVPYNLFRGIRDLSPDIERQVAEGAKHDVFLNWELFRSAMTGTRMYPAFPRSQLGVVSAYIEMFTEPSLTIDIPRAEALAARQDQVQEAMLDAVGAERDVIASREYFADLLREVGVSPPMKASPSDPAKTTYAFGKTDPGMKALLEHENPIVVELAEARLGVSSTINRTRALRYAGTARRGLVPVYLNWGSTFSTRTGGGDSMNWGNLQRLPNKVKQPDGSFDYERFESGPRAGDICKGELRLCVKAPPGRKLVIADLSQIEARSLALHAGQMDLVEAFARKEDVYSQFIQPYFPNLVVSKETPSERGIGKQLILSNGYQAGAKTTRATAALGSYGPPVYLTLEEADGFVKYYRQRMNRISGYPQKNAGHWGMAGRMIDVLAARAGPIGWGPVQVDKGRVWLPDGTWLDYTEMRRMTVDSPYGPREVWANRTRKGWDYLYPGKVTAHVNSAIARVVMTDALAVIQDTLKHDRRCRIALTVYDEIVACVPDEVAEQVRDLMAGVMARTPKWFPGLPVEVEAHIADRYDK